MEEHKIRSFPSSVVAVAAAVPVGRTTGIRLEEGRRRPGTLLRLLLRFVIPVYLVYRLFAW